MKILPSTIFRVSFAHFLCVIGIDVRPEIDRYCRNRERLMTSEELDDYLLVDAEINSTVLLECHFCNEQDDKQPKIWYFEDRYQTKPKTEVELGMNNNMSCNRIHVTPEFSLVIKTFDNVDAGIYRCHGTNGLGAENKFNYRIEAVYKDSHNIDVATGNISDWENYRNINLEPVTTRFAVSRMNDLSEIREAGIILELVSEWTPWSRCERQCDAYRSFSCREWEEGARVANFLNCFPPRVRIFRMKIFITDRAHRPKSQITIELFLINILMANQFEQTIVATSNELIMKFFSKFPLLPCRSQLLATEFPSISRATKDLPEFILEEKCKNCPRVKKTKKNKFKYKKRYTLAEGAHLAIVCPESSMETQVVWRKDSLLLKKGTGKSFRKKDGEPRVLVDTFSTLYLIDVSNAEEGNYTCYANDAKMMQVRIRVVSKSRLLTQAFLRHMGYLGFIFLLTSFCYCAGLVVVCREKDKFRGKDDLEMVND